MATPHILRVSYLLLFCTVYSVNCTAKDVYNSQNTEFQNAVYDPTSQSVYIGATNQILQLNASSLKVIASYSTGPTEDIYKCNPADTSCWSQPQRLSEKKLTDNYNTLLLYDSSNKHVIACGNVRAGSCFALDASNISSLYKESEVDPREQIARVDPSKKCETLLFSSLDGKSLMTSACDYTDSPVALGQNLVKYGITVRQLQPRDQLFRMFDDKQLSGVRHEEGSSVVSKFVTSFSAGMFVYVVHVGQMKSEAPRGTRIGRFSRKDYKYLSTYAEIPLKCTDSNGNDYPFATDLTVVENPTPGLHERVNSDPTRYEPVLVGIFRKHEEINFRSSEDSIVCGFSIQEIDATFKEMIKNCFEGRGFKGLGGLFIQECQKWAADFKDSDLIDPAPSNYFQITAYNMYPTGTQSSTVNGYEISVYRDELLTGIKLYSVDPISRAGQNAEFTNIILTTATGKLKKVAFGDTSSVPAEYFSETLFNGLQPAINRDIIIDVPRNSLLLTTKHQLRKVPIYDCGEFSSCGACLQSAGPHCGWCTLSDSCSTRGSCPYSGENAWIRFQHQCITINDVFPSMISTHYRQPNDFRPVRLTVSRLPQETAQPGIGPIYYCDFDGARSSFRLETTSTERGYCDVPDNTDGPFLLPPNQAFVTMRLSIVTTVEGRELRLTSREVKFYDCAALTSCITCTSSAFECDWCLSTGSCVNSLSDPAAARTSGDGTPQCHNHRVAGLHNNTLPQSSTPEGADTRRGAEFCPQVNFPNDDDSLKTFHVGLPISFQLAVKNIPSSYLEESESVQCVVTSGELRQLVPARTYDHYPDRVTCQSEAGLTIPSNHSSVTAAVTLQWGSAATGPILADNPNDVAIELYNCSRLASSCGECLSYVEPRFGCGFCQRSPGGYCTIQSDCHSSFMSNNPENICLNPSILKFSPVSGPPTGGTTLFIEGENLGRDADNVVSAYIDTKQGKLPCDVKREQYLSSKRIVCETSNVGSDIDGTVVLELALSSSDPTSTTEVRSSYKFAYKSPAITDFAPKFGPLDGGTHITINGTNLDSGRTRSISIGTYDCDVVSAQSTSMLCVTAPAKRERDMDKLELTVDDTFVTTSAYTFTYRANPTVDTITPEATLRSGGIEMNVTGSNLDTVLAPKIRLFISRSSDPGHEVIGPCHVHNPNLMSCISPPIGPLSRFARESLDILFYVEVGFIMDGAIEVRRIEDKIIAVYQDPEFYLSPKVSGSGLLEIYPLRPLAPSILSQMHITAGEQQCVILPSPNPSGGNLGQPVKCEIDPEAVGISDPVIISIGSTLQVNMGYLPNESVRSPLWEDEKVLMAAGVAIAGFILFIVILIVVVIRTWRRASGDSKKILRILQHQQKQAQEEFQRLLPEIYHLNNMQLEQVTHPPVNTFTQYCAKLLFGHKALHHPVFDVNCDLRSGSPADPTVYYDSSYSGGMPEYLQDLERMLFNKRFLITLMETLQAEPQCTYQEKTEFVSLLVVVLKPDMVYVTEVMETMLKTLIDDSLTNKYHPKTLFRRKDTMAEKLMSSWLDLTMYPHVYDQSSSVSKCLFELYRVLKYTVETGAVDEITGRSQYTLSTENLLNKSLNDDKLTLHVFVGEERRTLVVPAYDTVSQLKEKVMDVLYKHQPAYSRRPKARDHFLVVHSMSTNTETVISKETVEESYHGGKPVSKRLMLKDCPIREGDTVGIRAKPSATAILGDPRQPATPLLRIKDAWSTLRFHRPPATSVGGYPAPLERSGSGGYLLNMQDEYHLEARDPRSGGYPGLELEMNGGGGGAKKGRKGNASYAITETLSMKTYTTASNTQRLFTTKEATKEQIENLMAALTFSYQPTPFPIKYLFDLFDKEARDNQLNPDVVTCWKMNSVISGYWLNVINRPDYVLDVRRSQAVEASLQVVGQALMDACAAAADGGAASVNPREIPYSKWLFLDKIKTYKGYIDQFYQRTSEYSPVYPDQRNRVLRDISRLPVLLDQPADESLIPGAVSHDSYSGAALPQSEWDRKYRENAVALLHSNFIIKYASDIYARTREEPQLVEYSQKLAAWSYHNSSRHSINSNSETYTNSC